MNKLSTFLLLFLVGIGFNTVYGQDSTPLYAGQNYSTTLTTIDTSDWSVVTTVGLSSDYGSVSGTYGIATDVDTEDIYILYQSSGGSENRRLGTLDPESGNISDIGNAGNMTDLAIDSDGNLYGSGGNWTSYQIYDIDKVTGASSVLFTPPSASWGSSVGYNPFTDELLTVNRSQLNKVNPDTYAGTYVGASGGETHAIIVMDENTAMTSRYGSRYSVNLTTGTLTYVEYMGFSCHAMGFGLVPCDQLDITVSDDALCAGEEFTLTAVSETGGTITWTGGIENGVPFTPAEPGVYEYTPMSDSEDDCAADPVTINSIGLPTVLAGAGDLVFCEDEPITLSAAGDADLYVWNDGDDLDLLPGIGTYTFDLVGYYTEGPCLGENNDEITVEVVGLPTITASATDDLLCVNMEVTFTADGGEMYWWDNGVLDGEVYIPGTLGTTTYTVIGTDENGCSGTATVDVEVVDNIELSATSVIETLGADGEINIEIASGGAPTYTYDWDNDGTGDFDDDQDLTGLTAGEYTVVVRGAAGCETTRTFDLKGQVGIDDLNAENVAIYPNPTTEFVNIEFTGTFQYELIAINGDILVAGTATDKEVLNLKEFADGVYFVNIKNENATTTIKVVKK